MKPLKQRLRHDPDNGVWGDCHRAAVASVLELALDDVPHFYDRGEGQGEWAVRERTWLLQRGLYPISIPFQGDGSLSDLLGTVERLNPGLVFLLGGQSRNNCNHTVVCTTGEIILLADVLRDVGRGAARGSAGCMTFVCSVTRADPFTKTRRPT